MTNHDVVVMGGGHNQLGTAAYLAKAGKKVLVLEKKEFAGGGAVTLERTAPGFLHNKHSMMHGMIQANPMLLHDELGLKSKYGLEYNHPDPPMSLVLKDYTYMRSFISLDKTCDEIARFSPKDAVAYREFVEWGGRMMPMLMQGMFNVPVPMGAFMMMMQGNEDGRRLLDLMYRSPLQIVDELFESDLLKIFILKWASEGILQFPDDMGTGLGVIIMIVMTHYYPIGFAKGGSGELSRALVDCIKDHGGEVRLNTEVNSVIVESGRAVGLRSTEGEEFRAKDAVVAAIHPTLLGDFVEGLDDALLRRASKVKNAPYALFKVDAALDRPPTAFAGNLPDEVFGTAANTIHATNLLEFLENFEPLRLGRVNTENPLQGGGPMALPGFQPEGQSVLYMTSYQPFDIERQGPGKWDSIKEDVADRLLEKMSHFYPGLKDSVIAREVDSPLDMERWSPATFVNGEVHGAGLQLFQTSGMRPTPELAQYAVPGCEGLYLCGPFMHPGGAIFGAGRPTAIKIMDDLDIDFDKVIAGGTR
jgi:phytoene dehydrogenase-like protein